VKKCIDLQNGVRHRSCGKECTSDKLRQTWGVSERMLFIHYRLTRVVTDKQPLNRLLTDLMTLARVSPGGLSLLPSVGR